MEATFLATFAGHFAFAQGRSIPPHFSLLGMPQLLQQQSEKDSGGQQPVKVRALLQALLQAGTVLGPCQTRPYQTHGSQPLLGQESQCLTTLDHIGVMIAAWS